MNYSENIRKQLNRVNAAIESWEYRTLPAMRFIGLEYFYDGDDYATLRDKVMSVLDTMPEYASGFDYDLTFSHHLGKRVDEERNHDYIGRFMKADTPVPDGFVHWDFVPDDPDMPYLTFCSQFAFAIFTGDGEALHRHDGFDVHALYDITRNIILEEKVIIPYPEIYWTAEVKLDQADRYGWLFSTYKER